MQISIPQQQTSSPVVSSLRSSGLSLEMSQTMFSSDTSLNFEAEMGRPIKIGHIGNGYLSGLCHVKRAASRASVLRLDVFQVA